jgi:small-conductance mechanosensitive channel
MHMSRDFSSRWVWVACCLLSMSQVAVAMTASTTATTASGESESLTNLMQTVEVRFRDRPLFEVNSPIGELSVELRAQAIEQRLLLIAGGPAEALQTLRVAERNGRSEILAGDLLIRAVTDQDALPTGRTRRQLAADQLEIVREALTTEFRERGAASLARNAGIAAGATVLALGLLFCLRWVHRWIHTRLNRTAQRLHGRSRIADWKLLSAETVTQASRSIAIAVVWGLGLLLIFFYLEFVLSLFPWTRGLGETLVNTSRAAVVHLFSSVWNYLPSLINIILIIIAARFVLKVFRGFFAKISAGRLTISGFHPDWGQPTFSVVRFFVIAIAVVMIFPYLPGSGSEGFKGVSTFVGLAISFGGAPAIANIIAGIILTYMHPFNIGDRVKIADATGDVVAKNLLLVRLRTIKNVDISIPNALVLANHIVNFSENAKQPGLILNTTVTIGYDAPWQRVHELLITAAKRVDGVLQDPAPFVLQTSLDDFFVAYEINAFTDQPNLQAVLYSRLHTEIQNSFNEGGVEIMSPHYTAVRDGNRTAVPDDYLPKNYQAPGFTLLSRILRPGQNS